MFNTNFSRIKELFYRDASRADYYPNLRGFIGHALGVYYQRYIARGIDGETRKMIYLDDNNTNKLSLYVLPAYNLPDLAGLEIEAKQAELGFLLNNLRGKLIAEFSDLGIEQVDETIREKLINERDENYSQLGVLGVFFSENPQKPWAIKKAVLGEKEQAKIQKIIKKQNKKFKFLNLEQTIIDDALLKFLSDTEHVQIKNSSYEQGNRNKILIHESSELFQYEKGKWAWNYRIKAANNGGLPAYILPALESLFSTIEKGFSAMAFNRMKISVV